MNVYLLEFVKKTFTKPGKALDMGAGNFFDVSGLKQMGWKVEGVDLLTGVDLENQFLSKDAPFDLVYSNYVIHKIKNKKQFIRNISQNLKTNGYLFIHTFDSSDNVTHRGISSKKILKMLSDQNFDDLNSKIFPYYDNEPGHEHWHKILQVSAKKKKT